MKSLFARTLMSFSLVFLVFSLLISLAFIYGVRQSLQRWQKERQALIQESLTQRLSQLYQRDSGWNQFSLDSSIPSLLGESVFIELRDGSGRTVFVYPGMPFTRLSETVVEGETSQTGWYFPFLPKESEVAPMVIRINGQDVGYLVTRPYSFEQDRANRVFLDTLIASVSLSFGVSVCLAFTLSFLFSRQVAVQARHLADGLKNLTSGRRDIRFTSRGAKEMVQIGESAAVLQGYLKKEEELRRQWAQDIAHDLRTPISALKAQMEGMLDGVFALSKDRIGKVYDELLRLEILVHDLGQLVRVESPEMKLRKVTIPTEELFAVLRDRFGLIAERQTLTMNMKAEKPNLFADRELLFRAVSNIVQNAIQYSKENGEIDVIVTADGNDTVVIVENTGSFAEEELPHLFDRLYRGERSRSTTGHGLGLSIARAIAELHGGSIKAMNIDGKARVKIRLR